LTQTFTLDIAIQCASKAAYLAMILLRDVQVIEQYAGNEAVAALSISNSYFNKYNKIKKTDLQAFYYWCKAVELFGESVITRWPVIFVRGWDYHFGKELCVQ
jgi:acid phosphatase family membrane protein YuiD